MNDETEAAGKFTATAQNLNFLIAAPGSLWILVDTTAANSPEILALKIGNQTYTSERKETVAGWAIDDGNPAILLDSEKHEEILITTDKFETMTSKTKNSIKCDGLTKLGKECNFDFFKINQMLNKSHKYEYKKYKMPSGKFVNYQGYENYALDELTMNYNENDIKNERFKIPIIKYKFKNKELNYYPDIYIESENKLIEVKSEWTYKCSLIKNVLKSLAVKKASFNF